MNSRTDQRLPSFKHLVQTIKSVKQQQQRQQGYYDETSPLSRKIPMAHVKDNRIPLKPKQIKKTTKTNSFQEEETTVKRCFKDIDDSFASIQSDKNTDQDYIKVVDEIMYQIEEYNINAQNVFTQATEFQDLIGQWNLSRQNSALVYQKSDAHDLEITAQIRAEQKDLTELDYELQLRLKQARMNISNDERQLAESIERLELMKRKKQTQKDIVRSKYIELEEINQPYIAKRQDIESVQKHVAILKFQAQRRLRFGFQIYNNYDQELTTFNVEDWSKKRRIFLTLTEVKVWVTTKLYPLEKGGLRKFSQKSPIFQALLNGKLDNLEKVHYDRLQKYLYKTNVKTGEKTHRKISKTRRFIAVGSQRQGFFQLFISCLKQQILKTRGYLLSIDSIQIKSHPTHPNVYYFNINYRFDSIDYKKVFILFNLHKKVNMQVIEALTNSWKKKGEFHQMINSMLGSKRKGVIYMEIPQLFEKVKKQEYLKIYDTMKNFKQRIG